MKSRVDDDAFLFNEIKNAFNKKEQLLDMAIRSKLTQGRFNALDHALPIQQNVIRQDRFQWGMAMAVAVLFTVLFVMQFSPSISGNFMVAEELEDTDEALEMYEWLYNNYG